MESSSNKKSFNVLIIVYFAIAFLDIISEYLLYQPLIIFSRITSILILMGLYTMKSKVRYPIFYSILFFLLLSNIFFSINNSNIFFFGIITFIIQRILVIYLILKLHPEKNYLQILLATFPFLLVFFYLISVTHEISDMNLNILILQSLLISFLGGISLTSYLKYNTREHSWLLISTLLMIGLRFIVFIEKYYLTEDLFNVFRPISVLLNAFAFFTFYKFVIAAEKAKKHTLKLKQQ